MRGQSSIYRQSPRSKRLFYRTKYTIPGTSVATVATHGSIKACRPDHDSSRHVHGEFVLNLHTLVCTKLGNRAKQVRHSSQRQRNQILVPSCQWPGVRGWSRKTGVTARPAALSRSPNRKYRTFIKINNQLMEKTQASDFKLEAYARSSG
jgi:hypothetical protein